jgi:hypothetical protein
MAFDPSDLYDQNLGPTDEDPLVKLRKGSTSADNIYTPITSYQGFGETARNPEGYTGYLQTGLYEQEGRNPETERGEAQPMFEKLGNALVHTGGKFVTSLVDMAGSIGALVSEWGDERDYKNAATDVADNTNTWIDKNFPLYRSTEGTFGLTDASWWLSNASGLAASAGSFAIGGLGIAKVLGSVGGLLGAGARITSQLTKSGIAFTNATRAVGLGQEALTAGLLAYSEGAMSGRVVYDQVYKARIAAGDNEETARHMAAQSAATTVQLNTTINTGLNMLGGMSKFFSREKDVAREAAAKYLKGKAGETAAETAERLGKVEASTIAGDLGTSMSPVGALKKVAVAGKEAAAEGLEELTNLFAETVGTTEGKEGKEMGFLDQFYQMENYLKYTMNEEGALNFALGAIAGPIQQGLMNHIPAYKVAKGYKKDSEGRLLGEDGKPVKDTRDAALEYYENGKRMSAAKRNRLVVEEDFNDLRKRVVDDYTYIAKQQEELQKAREAGDLKKAKEIENDLYDIMNLNAVQNGISANYSETYKSLINVDNTKTDTEEIAEKLGTVSEEFARAQAAGQDTTALQAEMTKLQSDLATTKGQTAAMRLGLATSKEDNAYKEKAEQAIKELEALQKVHDTTFAKYGKSKDEASEEERHVFDFLYRIKAESTLAKMRSEQARAKRAKEDNSLTASPEGAFDDAGVAFELDAFDRVHRVLRDKIRKQRLHGKRAGRLQKIIDEVNATMQIQDPAEANRALEEILNRAGITAVMEGETAEMAGKRITKVLNGRMRKLNKEYEDILSSTFDDPAFIAWAEKRKKTTEFPDSMPADERRQYKKALVQDFWNDAQKKLGDSLEREQEILETQELEDKHVMLEAMYEDATSTKGLTALLRNTEKYFDKMTEKYQKLEEDLKRKNQEKYANESEQQAFNRKVRNRMRRLYGMKIKKVVKEIQDLRKGIAELRAKLLDPKTEGYGLTESLIREKVAKLKGLSALLRSYREYVNALENSIKAPIYNPPPGPAPGPPSGSATGGGGTTGPNPAPGPDPDAEETTDDEPSSDALQAASEAFDAVLTEVEPDPFHQENILEALNAAYDAGDVPLGLLSTGENSPYDSDQSAKVVTAFKAMKAEEEALLGEADAADAEAEAEVSVVPETNEGVDPIFANVEEGSEEPNLSTEDRPKPEDDKSEGGVQGKKQQRPANAGASKTVQFVETRNSEGKIERSSVDVADDTTEFDPKGTSKVLQHDQLKPGTAVQVAIDATYSGTRKVYNQSVKPGEEALPAEAPMSFQDFVDPTTGKIKTDDESISNVPIGISLPGSTTPVQWLHTVDWVGEVDPKANPDLQIDAFRNVGVTIRDKDGNDITTPADVLQRVAEEKARLFALRKAIVEAYNNGHTVGFETEVGSKSFGSLQYGEVRQATTLIEHNLRGGKIEQRLMPIGYVYDGKLNGTDEDYEGEISERFNRRVVALVRGANGQRILVPLFGKQLGTDRNAVNTVKEVTRLFLNSEKPTPQNSAAIKKIQDETGFNVGTRDGYRDFMFQYYTYISKPNSEKVGTRVMFDGKELKVSIRDASGSLQTFVIDIDAEGNLTEEASLGIQTLLDNRSRNVQYEKSATMRGLGSQGEFKEALYLENPDGTYSWSFPSHKSYNHYTVSRLTHNLVALQENKGGIPIEQNGVAGQGLFYAANPVIKYRLEAVQEQADAMNKVKTTVEDTTTVTTADTDPSAVTAQDIARDDFDDLFQEEEEAAAAAPQPAEPDSNAKELADAEYALNQLESAFNQRVETIEGFGASKEEAIEIVTREFDKKDLKAIEILRARIATLKGEAAPQPATPSSDLEAKKADIEAAYSYITTRKYEGTRRDQVNKVGEALAKRFVATLKQKGLVKDGFRSAERTDGSVEKVKVNTDAEGNNLGNDWNTAGKFKEEFRKFVDAELAALEGKPATTVEDTTSQPAATPKRTVDEAIQSTMDYVETNMAINPMSGGSHFYWRKESKGGEGPEIRSFYRFGQDYDIYYKGELITALNHDFLYEAINEGMQSERVEAFRIVNRKTKKKYVMVRGVNPQYDGITGGSGLNGGRNGIITIFIEDTGSLPANIEAAMKMKVIDLFETLGDYIKPGYPYGIDLKHFAPFPQEVKDDVKAELVQASTLIDESSKALNTEAPNTKTVGTQSKPPVSLESLQKLLNFTPQSERNGKTAMEVYDYLRLHGITHMADGYNPFKRCS